MPDGAFWIMNLARRSRASRLTWVLVAAVVAVTHETSLAADAVRFARDGHARLPFELQGGHMWVRGLIGESDSLWIVVDTGASSSAMDTRFAERLRLERRGQHETLGAGGTQQSSSVSDITIEIGDLSIHRESLDTVDFGALSATSIHPMQLVLGYELFESCIVQFDYAARMMDVWDAAHAPQSQAGVVLPMVLEENHPYVEGSLQVPGRAPLRGRFVIDTGSTGGLIVAPDVAAREKITQAFPRTLQVMGVGVGGAVRNHVGRAESFALGELSFDRPLLIMPDSSAGRVSAPGSIGNIGGELLSRCRVTFDYRRRRVCFERGAEFDRPFEADMSGIAFRRDASGWSVWFVNQDTPASEAGLREGDVVTSVDGEAAAGLSPATLRRLMRREGQAVRVGIRRGNEETTVTLVLRRLL